MKYFWILTLVVLASCTNTEIPETPSTFNPEENKKDSYEGMSKKEAIELHIRRELSISADQPLDYEIYEANCDGDDSLDAIITVNLLDRAVDEAIASENVAKRAAIGYMGRYNFIIYRDGFTGKMGSAKPIASSPKAKLKVSFENIRSEKQKDILVDYRILNAAYRNFYTITNGRPEQTNQVKLFDALGTPEAAAFYIAYEPGMISSAKDIVSYVGKFENPTFANPDDVYTYDLDVTKTDVLKERWFFNPETMKYYLKLD
ncbi:MAG: hypothetical protein HWE22_19455 [Flavobacteriales bacterium]|nr:hypothetical protein [Flavobacteriales bacterium]